MKTILTLLICSLTLAGWGQKKETLAYNLAKGETYTQTMELSNVVSQQIMGQQMKIDMTVHLELSYLVKEKDDAGYDLEVAYKRLGVSVVMPQGTRETSSANPDDPASRALAALVDKPFRVKMDALGKVSELTGLDALVDAALDAPEFAQFKRTFGSSALKQNIESNTALFPDHPVAEGDSWVQEVTRDETMPLKVVTTYTFRGVAEGSWKITGTSTLEVPNKDYIEFNGVQMKSDMTGTATGEYTFDKATGWPTAGKMTVNMKGTNHVKANERIPADMTVNMEIVNITTLAGSVKK
jgi:hypothetical protein